MQSDLNIDQLKFTYFLCQIQEYSIPLDFEAVIKAIYLKFKCPPAQCLTELLLSFMFHRCRCFAFVIIDLPLYLNILDVMPEIIIWAKG